MLRTFILTALFFPLMASAGYKEFYFKKHLNQDLLSRQTKESNLSRRDKYFDQKLNHFDPSDTRTFKQRWYISTLHARSNQAPVFYYFCGESTCEVSSVTQGFVVDLAKKFNGVIIALEHRYYGKSQPFSSLTTENMKYLSTDQALEDLAFFQDSITKEQGLNGPWIAIGGSYPGNLAAYYRLKKPELVVAALASSAPVKAEAEFDEYDAHVTKVVGPACSARMKEAVKEIEDSLDNGPELSRIKKMFNSQAIVNNVDFLYVIADIGAIAAQYGYVDKFCANLSQATNALEGYANFAQYILSAWRLTPEQISIGSATDLDPNSYLSGFGMRQWLYQSCTEYGFWQTAHKSESSRSSLIDLDYHNKICERLFGIYEPVDTRHINETFYAGLLDENLASNILFTNGSTDPWMNLSILPGQNSNPSVLTAMIEGAAHCDDVRSPSIKDSAELRAARNLFVDMLEGIL